jgi:O-antigen/teichoic acid export membrane protein
VNAPGIRRALVGAVWLSASGYLSFALNFGLNLLLVRLLFPKDFGQFALAGSLAELLSLITGLSFSQGIIQIQGVAGVADTAYVLSLRLYGGLLLGGAAITAALMPHYPGRFMPLFFALLAVRNLSLISYVYSAQLERAFLYSQISMVRLASTIGSIVVALGLARAGAGVWSLLGREVALSVITLAGVRMASGWRYRGGYSAEAAQRLWAFGRQMLTMRALEVVWYRADTALLGILAGTLALGFYDRGRYLAEFGHYMVSFAAVQVAFPVYARLQARQDALTYAYRLSHGLLIRLMLPYLLWLGLFPRELVGLLYGAGVRWNETAAVLPWLAVFGFLFPVVDNIKVMLSGIGRLREAVWIRLVQVVVALPLLVPAIVVGGPRGAALVMVLSEVAGLAAGYRALRSQVDGLNLSSYLRPAAAAVVAGGVVAAGRGLHLLPWVGRAGYAANLGAVAGLYLACLLIVDRQQIQDYLWSLLEGFRGQAPPMWSEVPSHAQPAGAAAGVRAADGDHRAAPPAPALPEDPP